MSLLEEGIERALLGVSSKARVMSEEERRMTAYHEAGHALVAWAVPGADAPHKITIVPRGHALGYTWQPDQVDRLLHTRSALMGQMAVGLAGRVAEELVFGDVGDGAANDLVKVTAVARRMVCELGMSDRLGPVSFKGPEGEIPGRGYSEDAARAIDAEIRRLVDEAHNKARAVITRSRADLDLIASTLLDRETLTSEDLEKLLAEASARRRLSPA